MKQTVFIPGPLPGLNEIIAASKRRLKKNGRRRVFEFSQMKADWDMRVSIACKMAGMVPMKRADIGIIWVEKDRRRDPDNIMAGKKFILDGLVKAGILKNDGWRQVGSFTEIVEVGELPGAHVTLIGE